jgi:hypothetical protein
MMRRTLLLAAGTAAVLAVGPSSLALGQGSGAQCANPYAASMMMCPGMIGPGMLGPGMMGPGMMGPGMGRDMLSPGTMGPGMMGPGMMPGMMSPGAMGPGMMSPGSMGPGMTGQGMFPALPQDLSAADVRHMLEHQVAWMGNPNLAVGKVEERDGDVIVAEIVTKDGSLVQRLDVDRHTGWMQPAEQQ